MANILILGVKVPFTFGGQEVLVRSLQNEIKKRGHTTDVLELPISFLPKENIINQLAIWRSLDLSTSVGRPIDLVIATKFPCYFARATKKSLWLVHQHRPIYELYGGRYSDISDDVRDEQLRRLIVDADKDALAECDFISSISTNVANRLKDYNGIDSKVLYPPLPLGKSYYCEPAQDYILSVSRLCSIKRVDLIIKALPIIHSFIKLKVVGQEDEPGIMDYFKNEIDKHHLWDRVEFLGRVSDEDLLKLYAESLAVYYAPHNEDYGYVTLEAMASGKALITAHDSGGTLEFIKHLENGLIVDPTSDAVGHAVNKLAEDKDLAKNLGQAGLDYIKTSGLLEQGWDSVVDSLLSPLTNSSFLTNSSLEK